MKVLKNNIINIKLLIKGIIIGGIIGCIGVGAATYFYSDDAYYDNSNTNLVSTNVQDALDELYLKVNPPATAEGTLYYQMMSNASLDTSISFSSISSSSNGLGVYEISSTANDEYPIYYYRGAVEDNNVLFATFCWKIVRTTETGGVKLIYNGEPSDGQCDNTGTASQLSSTRRFNSSYNKNAYVGYMYGTPGSSTYTEEHANTNDSTIKTVIDTWYESNMTSYTYMLEDTVWCNDRSYTAGGGYSSSTTYYKARRRLYEGKKPSLTCTNDSDKFTVSSTNGNGALTYPVSLLTADEVAYAGGVSGTSNKTYYLYTGQTWWLLSPYLFDEAVAYVYATYSLGYLGAYDVSSYFGVRPAISLKPGTTYKSGDGTSTSPYVVS
jgi:hypothetical protein